MKAVFNWVIENPEITIAILAFIVSIVSVFYTRKTQKDTLLHNISMARIELWTKKSDEKPKIYFERLVNFYEYIAFLTIRKEINKKYAKELFKDDIDNLFERGEKQIREDKSWKDVVTLYEMWKED